MKYANLTLAKQFTVGKTDERIFGSFVEHLGRSVYGGIYEPGHPSADENGFRTDVIDLIRELGVTLVRYPGGNFVSGYNWRDGIGPKENRPRRMELAWNSTETNRFGTDEFADWCRKTGVEPLLAVNLGTGTPEQARQLVEYCNHPSGTALSDERRANGHEAPHAIRLWCLGNEMDGGWQMGHKTASEYGRTACETAKLIKWTDPGSETVVCGSSGWGMSTFGEWETTVLEEAWDHVDYISMHQYHGNGENDLPNFLAKSVSTEKFIQSVIAACDYVQGKRHSDKQMNVSFDEWNVWYHSNGTRVEPWSEAPPILEDHYNFADALVVAMMMNAILRHCDRVKIACLAQLVNVIAPIMTENGGPAWRQTIFHPFRYASLYGRGTVLEGRLDSSVHDTKDFDNVPDVDIASVLSDDGNRLTLFAVNRDLEDSITLRAELLGFDGFVPVMFKTLAGFDAEDVNTAENEKVRPADAALPTMNGRELTADLAAFSWNMIVLEKRG